MKYSLILPLIHGTYTQGTQIDYCRDVAKTPITFSSGNTKMVKPRTILQWFYNYKERGFDGLLRKTRSDKGTSRKLTDEAISSMTAMLEETPKISATKMYKNMQGRILKGPVSVDVVQRYVKEHAMRAASPKSSDDMERTAFEASHFGELWQADTLHGPHIRDKDGTYRKIYCIVIIDDHTRYIVAGEFFFADNAVNFQKVLNDAIRTHGMPRKLLIDNGSSFKNGQVAKICMDLGINLIAAPAYTPEWKAKIERFNKTIRTMFLDTISPHKIESLEHANDLYQEFLDTYHHKIHAGICTTPYERYEESLATSFAKRPSADASDKEVEKWLHNLEVAFLNRTERRVRKDNTIMIDKVYYDIPPKLHLAGQKIEVRFRPFEGETDFYLFYNNQLIPIHPTDKAKNFHTFRKKKNECPEPDYSIIPTD